MEPDALYADIGARVRTVRTALGLTQEEVAHRLGYTRTAIVNLEAGRERMPLHRFLALAAILRAPLATLLPTEMLAASDPDLVLVEMERVRRERATICRRMRALLDDLGEDGDDG